MQDEQRPEGNNDHSNRFQLGRTATGGQQGRGGPPVHPAGSLVARGPPARELMAPSLVAKVGDTGAPGWPARSFLQPAPVQLACAAAPRVLASAASFHAAAALAARAASSAAASVSGCRSWGTHKEGHVPVRLPSPRGGGIPGRALSCDASLRRNRDWYRGSPHLRKWNFL